MRRDMSTIQKPTVREVAKYFLTRPSNEDGHITHLKLYKLVYYAQALSLAILKRPLFHDRIEARKHGPVSPVLWEEYKEHASNPVPIPQNYDAAEHFSEEELDLLHEVNQAYARYDAWYLSDKTHEEGPYQMLYAEGQHNEYDFGKLEEYYSSTDDKDVRRVANNFYYIRKFRQSAKDYRDGNVKQVST